MGQHQIGIAIVNDFWRCHTDLFARARDVLAGGVSAATRQHHGLGHPLYIHNGAGALLTDVNGREYIDLCMSNGATLFGHGWQGMQLVDNLDDVWGYESEAVVRAAELVSRQFPAAEKMRFCLSGTEAVQHAVRIARSATGKDRLLKFAGHYHGNADPLQVNWADFGEPVGDDGTCPLHAETYMACGFEQKVVVAPYNCIDSANAVFATYGHELAAVILEPVAINAGCVAPIDGFLEAVRTGASNCGALLIYDEILSGFRCGIGGAEVRYGVSPDIITLGKVLGGGWPVSLVAGCRKYIDLLSETGSCFHSGTHTASNLLAKASIRAVEKAIEPGLLEGLDSRCHAFVDELGGILTRSGVRARLEQTVDRFSILFDRDPDEPVIRPSMSAESRRKLRRFAALACEHGVYMRPQMHHGISCAHDQQLLDVVIARLANVISAFSKEMLT